MALDNDVEEGGSHSTTLSDADTAAVARMSMFKTGKMLRLFPSAIGMLVVMTDNAAAGSGGVQIGSESLRENAMQTHRVDSHIGCANGVTGRIVGVVYDEPAARTYQSGNTTYVDRPPKQCSSSSTLVPTNKSHQCCHPASSPSNRNNQKHSKCKRTNNQYPSNVVKSRSTPTTQSRRTKYTTMMSSFRLLTFDSFQSQGRTLAGVVHVVSESVRQRSLYVPWSRMRRSSDLAIVFHRPFALKDLQKQSPAKSVLAFMQRARQRSDRTQQYQKYQQQ